MQVYKLCQELGFGFADFKKEIKDIAEDMGIELKKLRPMSKFTDEQVEELSLMFQKKELPVKKPTIPWKAARLLDVPKELQIPGFRARWCTDNKPGNIRKKQSEGWEFKKISKEKMEKLMGVPTLEDGKALDGIVRVREMVLMYMPEEMALARAEYYRSRGETATKSKQQELDNEVRKLGGKTYGGIEERVGT
jgi:hypothetical protein